MAFKCNCGCKFIITDVNVFVENLHYFERICIKCMCKGDKKYRKFISLIKTELAKNL